MHGILLYGLPRNVTVMVVKYQNTGYYLLCMDITKIVMPRARNVTDIFSFMVAIRLVCCWVLSR